jgi:cytochrome oxidase assembly protein ShyY1
MALLAGRSESNYTIHNIRNPNLSNIEIEEMIMFHHLCSAIKWFSIGVAVSIIVFVYH